MQPHHTVLSVPVSTKPKRRTVHLALNTINKKSKCSPDQVYIRELTVSQGGLGCAIWDGSIVLARWMHLHPECFSGMVGMELGAGVGVPGIVAARYAKRVVLTDYMEEVINNLAYNLKLNSNCEQDCEDDEETDPQEIERRQILRRNVRASGSSALLDWHAIDPDEEDLERLKASAEMAAAAADERRNAEQTIAATSTIATPVASSSTSSSSSIPHMNDDTAVASLSDRLAALPFTPSPHFVDPTGLGPESCDFLIGAELIYTYNKHHQHCFLRILQYYLKPGGRYYCVQSMNREGMPEFVEGDLLQHGFTVHWQTAEPASGIIGSYRTEKVPKGFVQRDEHYVFYVIQKSVDGTNTPIASSNEITHLSLPGGELVDARQQPVPQVSMLRDGSRVCIDEVIPVTAAGQKLVEQLLPKAFQTPSNDQTNSTSPTIKSAGSSIINSTSSSTSTTTSKPDL